MHMKYAGWLKWVLLIGLSATFFIPFLIADGSGLVLNMFFPFITGKNFAFRIAVELLFGVYVILALKEPKYRPRTSLLLYVFGAFVLWMAVATAASVDPVKSFWSNFERMEGYITVLHLFLYFTMVGSVMGAADWWKRFFQVSVAAASLEALYALGQLIRIGGLAPSSQSGDRLDGHFGNAAYLGIFMLFNTFVTLYLLVRDRRSKVAQAVYGFALVLEVVVLYFTQTRSAFLGLLGGVVVAALYVVWKARGYEWKTLRRISMYALGSIAVLFVVFFAVKDTSFVRGNPALSRFASISLTDSGSQARFQIWDMAFNGFKQSPKTIAVGWGQENFSFVFNKYYTPPMYAQEQWFDRAHNQFLDWLIAGGLPAFLLYVSLFVLAVLAITRSELEAPEQAVLLGLLAGYAFNNLFVFDDLMSSLYFFAVLAYLHSLSKRALPGWLVLSRPVGDRGVAVVAPILAAVVLVGVWALNAPGIARARNLVEAITPAVLVNGQAQAKDPKMSLEEFKVALGPGAWPGTPLGTQEVTEQLFQFSSNAAASQSVDPVTKQGFATLAQSAGQALLAQRSHDARLELFYGSTLESFGQLPQALQYIQSALADSPAKQQIMFEQGLVYINGKDFPDALASFKQAFEEAPQYRDARILYAVAFYYAGDQKSGDALLLAGPTADGFGTVLVDDQRLIQAYTNLKQFDRIVGIWKMRVAANPNDAQTNIGLAAAYFSASDIPSTITQLKHAEQVDPAHAGQIEAIIGKIKDGSLKPGQ
ncbi:MAG: O-antigen ligase family protein [bacterium]